MIFHITVPGSWRADLQFAEMARSTFRFLESDFRFHCTVADTTFVRFESSTTFVNIYHGRSSYEFGVEIGYLPPQVGQEEEAFSLEEMLAALGIDHKFRFMAGRTREIVQNALSERAVQLRKHIGFLQEDPHMIDVLRKMRYARSETLAKESHLRQVREEAERAWQSKAFERVTFLYESIAAELTDLERKKLEYARSRLSTSQEKRK